MDFKKAMSVLLATSLICTSALSTVSPVYAQTTDDNALVNYFTDPDFNDSADSTIKWTSTWNGTAFTREYISTTTNNGENDNVLKISSTLQGNQRFEIKGLKPSTTYKLDFSAMTDGAAVIAVFGFKTGDLSGTESVPAALTSDWKDYSLEFTTGENITKVTVNVWNKGAINTYVDDFVLMYEESDIEVESNNPADEVLDDTPEYLPMSDPDNTKEWSFSETFSDEFEGETLDTSKWIDGKVSWVGRAPAYYKYGQSFVKDGQLILRSDWTGEVMTKNDGNAKVGDPIFDAASITGTEATGYGYYEISSRTSQIGLTSAFWMRNALGDEIDVFEQVGRSVLNPAYADTMGSNTHRMVDGKDTSTPLDYDTGIDLTLDYHTYGVDYSKEYIKFYFDGKLVNILENPGIHSAMPLRFDTEAFSWHGYPSEEAFYTYKDPKTGEERYTGDFNVEYIRVWRTDTESVYEEPEVEKQVIKETQGVYGTPADITEDGTVDSVWDKAVELDQLSIVMGGPEKLNVSADIKTMWDNENLYVLATVDDNSLFVSPNTSAPHNGDCLDLYFDFGNEKATGSYDANDFSIKAMPDGETFYKTGAVPEGTYVSGGLTEEGYTLQVTIPWTDEVSAKADTVIGFDAQINEGNTSDKMRVATIIWNSEKGDGWKHMETVGDLKLSAPVVVEPTAPVEPTNVVAKQTSDSVINVSWDAVEGADGYVVYRVVNGKDIYYRTVKNGATSVSNGGKVADTTYTYKVRAYTLNSEDKKLYSEFVETSCTTAEIKVDLTNVKIENLNAVATSTARIEVSWDKAEDVKGYEVYRVVNGKDYLYKTTTATSLGNAGKVADTTYTYKVRGYAVSEGEKVYTDFATVSCTTPSK